MKTNMGIIRESFSRVLLGKWFVRIIVVTMLLGSINNLANGIVATALRECEIQTWFDYLEVKLSSLAAGVECAVPSRAIAMQMNQATTFAIFIAFVFGGITLFGMTAIALKSAKKEDHNWFRDSLSGFARPLGLAWLGFVVMVLVSLWSLLLIVPGIVAGYRYSQCWNLKVEHPDWSASKCLSESARIMAGHKKQRFLLDLFFLWCGILLAMALLLVLVFAPGAGLAVLFVQLIGGVFMMFFGMWIAVARAIFYKALPDKPDSSAQTSSASIESQTSEPRSVSL